MATETELKLRLSPEHLARLRRCALFRTNQLAAPVTRRLYNIYYDTEALDLHRSQMALRLRRIGKRWVQTLKGGGSVKAGLHQRSEWEMEVSKAALDFSMLAEAGVPLPSPDTLQALFVTDFYRTSRMMDWHGARIEVCMDRGLVTARGSSAPICEVELELKSGDPLSLFELAQEILNIVPFELEVVSKAELGFRLLSGHVEQPVRSVAPVFSKKDKLTQVLQALIWSCLTHFQGNLRGALGGSDAEYLHQMRVALRRLRVVLNMAQKLHSDETLRCLIQEVANLAAMLGRIREWDVFIDGIARPASEQMADHAGLKALLERCEGQRSACYETLRGVGVSMQQLLLRFSIWMNGPYWTQAKEGAPRTHEFARRHLSKLAKRYAQAGRHPGAADADRLHKMRILAKKLRYSADFFAGLYGSRKTAAFLNALGEVQGLLGLSNDVSIAHGLLDEMSGQPELAAHLEAIRLAKGWADKDLLFIIKMLHDSIGRFSRQAAFWEK